MKSSRLLLAVAATALLPLAFLATGCQSQGQVNTFESTSTNGVITDKALAKAIHVEEVVRGRAGNLLKVQVSLRNASRRDEYFHYQFSWVDADGMLLNNPPPIWETKSMLGGETDVITAVAPNPRAVDFRLKMTQSNLPNRR